MEPDAEIFSRIIIPTRIHLRFASFVTVQLLRSCPVIPDSIVLIVGTVWAPALPAGDALVANMQHSSTPGCNYEVR